MGNFQYLFFFLFCLDWTISWDPGACSHLQWQTDYQLDLRASKEAGASLGVTAVYVSSNRTSCAEECCSQLKGTCQVASYKLTRSRCYHYLCRPLSSCLRVAHEGSELLLLDQKTNLTDEEVAEVEEGSLKQDNLSVVPHKGVPVQIQAELFRYLPSTTAKIFRGPLFMDEEQNSTNEDSFAWNSTIDTDIQYYDLPTALPVALNASVSWRPEEVSSDPLSESLDASELRSTTYLHLVIGLALGFLLLLTVLAVVGKRVHDSWQRRHYHRMDFLIDGLYHGES